MRWKVLIGPPATRRPRAKDRKTPARSDRAHVAQVPPGGVRVRAGRRQGDRHPSTVNCGPELENTDSSSRFLVSIEALGYSRGDMVRASCSMK